PARLLQNRDALLRVAGLLFFINQAVEFGILVFASFAGSRTEVLIVYRIGVDRRPSDVVKRQFSTVNAFLAPENDKFLRNQLCLDAGFRELVRDDLANFAGLGITVGRKIKLYIQAVRITCLCEQLPGLFGIV